MPKISIVVPVYNTEKYLEQCIKSLINQTFNDIEIILVDDGSPDNCPAICDRYAEEDERIKVIHKQNAGVSEARNSGIEASQGDFLMFVDSDDWMEPDGCEILYNEYLRTGADTVIGDVFTAADNKQKKRIHVFKESYISNDKFFFREYQRACLGYGYNPRPYLSQKYNVTGIGSPWNKLYSRSIIKENQLGFDPYVKGIYDDNLFVLHYLCHVKKIAYIAKPVYDYRSIQESITKSYKADTLDISARIFQRIRDFIRTQEDPDFFVKASYIYVIRRLSQELGVYYFSENNQKTLKEIKKELSAVLQTPDYKEAIQNVEPGKLMLAHKITWFCAKIDSPDLMYIQFRIRNWIKNKR